MNLLGILIAPDHIDDVWVVHCGEQIDLAPQVIEPVDFGLVHRFAGVVATRAVIDALVDLAVGTLANHFREDCVIVVEVLATTRWTRLRRRRPRFVRR